MTKALGLRTGDIHMGDDRDEAPDYAGHNDAATTMRRVQASADTRQGGLVSRPEDQRKGGLLAQGRPGYIAALESAATSIARPAATVTIARSLRYIAPELRAPNEGPYRLTGTKTGETREVPLPGFVADALRERLAERAVEQRAARVWAPNDLVFCDPHGNSVPLETLRTWYLGALERAGLPRVRWHSLRATTITLLVDMGVDLLTIQRIAGHRDLATTRLYVGKTPAAMAAAGERLDEAMR